MFFNLFGQKHTCKRGFDGLKKGDKFHFIAMGGVGQSALAKILLKLGYEVSGSDINDSKYLKELKSLGAKVFVGHNADNVPSDCFIVLSSAIKENNPELIKAKELGLTILHRSDLLLAITREFPLTIGFAGTHGKTTTSGLASYVLSKMKAKAAYAVGGIIPEINTNADASKDSNVFAAELDESDGTIVKYSPEILVINNLEADHLDFYKNGLDDVIETFKGLILKLHSDSKIIVNADNGGVLELLSSFIDIPLKQKVVKFSVISPDVSLKDSASAAKHDFTADVSAQNLIFNEVGAEFDVIYQNKNLGKISTSLKGIHNVYNALAVAASLLEAGFKFKDFAPHFKGFTGMGRRFQTVFKNENTEIIDDYAHHPSEIKATLKAAAEYKLKSGKDKVVAIFQPHRYTRLKALWEDFMTSFNDCDTLFVVDTYSAGDEFDPEFNSENFVKLFKEKNPSKDIYYVKGKIAETPLDIMEKIQKNAKSIILTLGAGDITKLGMLLSEELGKKLSKED